MHNVIEACITYRRDPDRKFFGRRAFYFLNPEGRWVSEADQSIHNEEYTVIMKAARESTPCGHRQLTSPLFIGDILHGFDLYMADSTH